jgi:hypothetical protein
MHVRLPFAILALAVAFGAGVGSAHFLEREARAQSSQTASVYVPPDGLTFRSPDGRVIARLSYDGRGGAFEVYDGHERPASALRPAFAPLPVAERATSTTSTMSIDLGY